MTPRTEVEAIPVTTTLPELIDRAAAGTHSRLPVYDGSLDSIVGVLHLRDLFSVFRESDRDIRTLIRPVMTVPESKPADDLLAEMQATRRHLAVVIDEYGGTAGVITIEDLVEALVGPIEEDTRPGSAANLRRAAPSDPLDLDGLMRLPDVEEVTGLHLNGIEQYRVETLGGLVMTVLGRIPEEGDTVTIDGHTLQVRHMDGRRVAQIRLLPDRDR